MRGGESKRLSVFSYLRLYVLGRGGGVTDQVVKWVCGAAAPTGAPRLFTVHPNRQPKVFIATVRQPTRSILN